MKYLILGRGYMGYKFNNFLEDSAFSKKRITCSEDVIGEIVKFKPEIVINCIGKTGDPNIDWCEDHRGETMFGNVTVPLLILEACLKSGVRMVHLSSGCIYNGDNNGRGFSEDDEPNFYGSFYSRTKIYAEKLLKEFDVLQLRLRLPMDNFNHHRNIITKLASYKKIIDVENSLTYTPDMLPIAKKLMDMKATGIFNVVCKGTIRWPKLMSLYKEIVYPKHTFEVISLQELGKMVKAERSNCVLSVGKLESLGIKVRHIDDVIVECLEEYNKRWEDELRRLWQVR